MEYEKLTSLHRGSPNGTLPGSTAPDAVSTWALTSVLLDGELRGEEFAQACAALASDAQARQRWLDYQIVGEALRHGAAGGMVRAAAHASRTHDELFLSRLRIRLAQEAWREDARDRSPEHPPRKLEPDRRRAARTGANDAYGAWRLTAGLCVLAVVGLLGWQGVSGLQSASQTRQLAQARSSDARLPGRPDGGRPGAAQRVSTPAGGPPMFTLSAPMAPSLLSAEALGQDAPMVMLRDPRLDHLMARQGAGGAYGRATPDGRYTSPRFGRAGVAAQGVLVNLEKSPAAPR